MIVDSFGSLNESRELDILKKGFRRRRNSLFHIKEKPTQTQSEISDLGYDIKSSPSAPVIRTRENGKLRVARVNSKSFTHGTKRCEMESPLNFCSPRTALTLPLVESCINYLNSVEGYKTPGIFREAGNFNSIQASLADIKQTSLEKHPEIFAKLGVIGTANLLKTLLKLLERPLIDENCFEQLRVIAEMKHISVDPQSCDFQLDELQNLYYNAVLTSTRFKEMFGLLSIVLSFLVKVAKHEKKSKMGFGNIATVFAPLILPTPETTIMNQFIEENKARIALLENLLRRSANEPKSLDPRFSVGKLESLFATKSGTINGECVIRGDCFTVFHRKENLVCVLFGSKALVIPTTQLDDLFCKKKKLSKSRRLSRRITGSFLILHD
mmetsp:Transcript_23162/g.35252  ORF Transcript_23162/g.35252 Transcript_23162/m.35252 type:complete len:383 (+) Transcript_23162:39-1187(+)